MMWSILNFSMCGISHLEIRRIFKYFLMNNNLLLFNILLKMKVD